MSKVETDHKTYRQAFSLLVSDLRRRNPLNFGDFVGHVASALPGFAIFDDDVARFSRF